MTRVISYGNIPSYWVVQAVENDDDNTDDTDDDEHH